MRNPPITARVARSLEFLRVRARANGTTTKSCVWYRSEDPIPIKRDARKRALRRPFNEPARAFTSTQNAMATGRAARTSALETVAYVKNCGCSEIIQTATKAHLEPTISFAAR